MKKIALFSNTLWSVINFRTAIITDLVKAGHEVTVLAPPDEYISQLQKLPVSYVPIKHLDPKGKGIWNEIKLILELRSLFAQSKFDYLLGYTIKPNVYSCLASWRMKQKNITTINGLGYTFNKKSFFNSLIVRLYRFSLKNAQHVIFQNPDDLQVFVDRNVIPARKAMLVNGSGIDTEEFLPAQRSTPGDHLSFIYCARLVKEKGIEIFINAAEQIKKEYPKVQCIVHGIIADNPSAISEKELMEYHQQAIIDYRGKTNDMNAVLSDADVAVMPSYYREGVPRFLLEGLSKGLPILTTNSVGCKETVEDAKNGFLIDPRSVVSLTTAMKKIIEMPLAQRHAMGLASRALAISKFDVHKVNATYLNLLDS